jgi:pimeloyl-ACP methyl ester carboxylesterase
MTEMRRIRERTAGPLHVAVGGDPDAPPIVLVHGLGGSWRSWGSVPERLAETYRVAAVDLPGFGRSRPLPGRAFPLDGVAARLAEALDALGIDEHLLVGHSLGGGVSIAYASERPQRVSGLVLVAPAGLVATGAVRPSWRRPALHRFGREATRFAEPLLLVSGRMRRVALSRLAHDPEALRPTDVRALVRGSVRGKASGPAGLEIVQAALLDRIDRLTMPTVVIWGDHDQVIGAGGAERFARALPDGRLVFLRDTGHIPQMERPDEVVQAIAGLAAEAFRAVSCPT